MIIDYPQKKFYFKPNENFHNRYAYNVAGIEIIQITPFIMLTEVLDVWKNSPAERAGIKKDDRIIEINGIRAYEMTVSEIRKIFETPSVKPMKLIIQRGEKEISLEIDMKDMI